MQQDGSTALNIAAKKNSLDVAKLLLKDGAAVDTTDEVRAYCSDLLLHASADFIRGGQNGYTPLDVATMHQWWGVVELLSGAGADWGTVDVIDVNNMNAVCNGLCVAY